MGVFTATFSVPPGMRIFPTVPSSTASTSIVALSVSISASTSPAATRSPSLTCHVASLPSVIVGDRAGMVMVIGILGPSLIAIADGFGRLDNLRRGWQRQLLEIGGIGHRDILPRYPQHRRIEIVKRLLHHLRRDFRADPALRPTLLNSHAAVGLPH